MSTEGERKIEAAIINQGGRPTIAEIEQILERDPDGTVVITPPQLTRDDQLRMAALQAAATWAAPDPNMKACEVIEAADEFYNDWLNKPPSATG